MSVTSLTKPEEMEAAVETGHNGMILQHEPGHHDLLSIGIRDRDLGGYLENDMPDMLMLLPPPPEKGSYNCDLDLELSKVYLDVDNHRKLQAKRDAILQFPDAIHSFNEIVDGKIDRERTPSLYRILERTCVDGGRSTGPTKRTYLRPRPFMVNHLPTLTPWDEELLRTDGSYPSGHTAIGWIWALILSDLFPSKEKEIIERGFQFGISRAICNVHWYSDIVAGRICGARVKTSLYANPEFLYDFTSARRELARLGLDIAC